MNRLSTPFKLVTGCAAMTALLMIFAVPRMSREEPNIVMRVDSGALQDSIAEPDPATEPVVRIVQTSKIASHSPEPMPKHPDIAVTPPVTMPPVVMVQDDDEVIPPVRQRHRRRHEHRHDVCTRHHMRKVDTYGGRSWRCQ